MQVTRALQRHGSLTVGVAERQLYGKELKGRTLNVNEARTHSVDVEGEECQAVARSRSRARAWRAGAHESGQLLKRVFDIEHCPHCGGALKMIAAIEDPTVIVRILTHLGLAPPEPRRAHRRGDSIYSKRLDPQPIAIQQPSRRYGSARTRANSQIVTQVSRSGRCIARSIPARAQFSPNTRAIDCA
jgi:hypothetical protein